MMIIIMMIIIIIIIIIIVMIIIMIIIIIINIIIIIIMWQNKRLDAQSKNKKNFGWAANRNQPQHRLKFVINIYVCLDLQKRGYRNLFYIPSDGVS